MSTRKSGKRGNRHRKLEKLCKYSETLTATSEVAVEGIVDKEIIALESTMSSEVGRCKSAAHRSGYDAFMTGYAFVGYLISNSVPLVNGCLNKRDGQTAKIVNHVFLTGKEQPLQIRASNFSKTSKNHKQKMDKLRGSS